MGRTAKRKMNFAKLVSKLNSVDDQIHFLQVLLQCICFFSNSNYLRITIFFQPPWTVTPAMNFLQLFIPMAVIIFFTARNARKKYLSEKILFSTMQILVLGNSSSWFTFLCPTFGLTNKLSKKLILPALMMTLNMNLMMKTCQPPLQFLEMQLFQSISHFFGKMLKHY